MWCLLLFLAFSLPVQSTIAVFNLTECNHAKNFDIVQDTQPTITCTGLGKVHNIYWSITDSSGNETRIGECKNCNKVCPPCNLTTFGFNMSRNTNETQLQFLNLSKITSDSTVKCSNFKNTINTTCRLNVVPAYELPECVKGTIVVESSQTPVRCEGLQPAQSMYWTITYLNGTVSRIADCKACGRTCRNCTVENDDFTVTRQHNSSTLKIKRNLRQKDGATLTCSKRDNVTRDSCRVRIEYPGDLEATNVTLHANWTLTGRVRVVKAFVSHPNITCVWYNSVGGKSHRLSSSRTILKPYNDSANSLTYFNGSCDLVARLNRSMTGRNGITVRTLPGWKPVTAGIVTVEKPGPLTLDNSTCLSCVTEGSNVTCTCRYENGARGYPPGKISWTEDAGSAVLELQNVSQNHSGAVFVCRSLWGPHDKLLETLNYSIIVDSLCCDKSSSAGMSVAGVVGGVVVVVIVAVVVVIAVIVRRRRSKKEEANGRQGTVPHDDEFEEHINEFYQSADNLSLTTRSSPQSPASLTFVNSSFRHQEAAPRGQEDFLYAQVNKERKGDKPELGKGNGVQANEGKQPCTGERREERGEKKGAVYANCDSKRDKNNSASNVYTNTDELSALASSQGTVSTTEKSGTTDMQDPDPNTYYNIATTQTKGDYTNTMPTGADDAKKTAETDAEYNHLQFSRPQQSAKDPTYNHLTKV